MAPLKRPLSKITLSNHHCDVCEKPLLYVQVLNDELRLQDDFFECSCCKKRIESVMVKGEDIPEFS